MVGPQGGSTAGEDCRWLWGCPVTTGIGGGSSGGREEALASH